MDQLFILPSFCHVVLEGFTDAFGNDCGVSSMAAKLDAEPEMKAM